jgi:hypothetical protein
MCLSSGASSGCPCRTPRLLSNRHAGVAPRQTSESPWAHLKQPRFGRLVSGCMAEAAPHGPRDGLRASEPRVGPPRERGNLAPSAADQSVSQFGGLGHVAAMWRKLRRNSACAGVRVDISGETTTPWRREGDSNPRYGCPGVPNKRITAPRRVAAGNRAFQYSLRRPMNSLLGQSNSLLGGQKFPAAIHREFARKPLRKHANLAQKTPSGPESGKIPC